MLHIFFFFNDTATTEIYTLSLHDALPISAGVPGHHDAQHERLRSLRAGQTGPVAVWHVRHHAKRQGPADRPRTWRSEEHTSELQSPCNLVCRLLLEKKKTKNTKRNTITST